MALPPASHPRRTPAKPTRVTPPGRLTFTVGQHPALLRLHGLLYVQMLDRFAAARAARLAPQ